MGMIPLGKVGRAENDLLGKVGEVRNDGLVVVEWVKNNPTQKVRVREWSLGKEDMGWE